MKMKPCKNCGKLIPTEGRQKLCDDCKNYLKRPVMRPCRRCGTIFLAERQRRLCDACRQSSATGERRTCKICGAEIVGRPKRTLCDDCRKNRRYVSSRQHVSTKNPFAPYQEPITFSVRCEMCGTETAIRRAYGNRYCKECGALVYSAEIDNPKYKKDQQNR